jgi:transcriptional regulator with XRE-family HTH domain
MSEQNKIEFVVSSPDDMRLALQQARITSGMSQQELAEEADTNRSYLSRMENGEISLAYMERLLDMFRICGATVTVSFDSKDD